MRASKQRIVPTSLALPALWFCACNLVVTALSAQCTNPTAVLTNQTVSSGSATYTGTALTSNGTINGSSTINFFAGNCIDLTTGFHAKATDPGAQPTTFHAWVDSNPTVLPASPSSGTGYTQQFTWTVSSPGGAQNLTEVYALFGTSTSGQSACYIRYLNTKTSNLLSLKDDQGNWLGNYPPQTAGATISNLQCSINVAASTVISLGNQLILSIPVTFQPAFGGLKNNYFLAYDAYGFNSEWQQVGTWNVAPPPPDFSVSLSSASAPVVVGGSTTYTLTATPINSFTGPINLSVASPAGLSITPAQVTISGSSPVSTTVTITSVMGAPVGTGALTINATASGTGTHSATSPIVIESFDITVTPPVFEMKTNTTGGTIAVQVVGSSNFDRPVTLSFNVNNCNASVNNASFTPAGMVGGGATTLTINSGSTGILGANCPIVAQAGGVSILKYLQLNILQTYPTVTVTPAAATVAAGQILAIYSNTPVTWQNSGSGALASQSPTFVIYQAPSGVSSGTATITATGIGAGNTATATITIGSAPPSTPANIITPPPGTTIQQTAPTTNFTWDSGTGVTDYELDVYTADNSLYYTNAAANVPGNQRASVDLSRACATPQNLTVRLLSRINGTQQPRQYLYNCGSGGSGSGVLTEYIRVNGRIIAVERR